jgi:hypothetical protein
MEGDLSNEWTDELKLDFLKTFLPTVDAIFTDSSRSGFHAKYHEWCERHKIASSNSHGGYSFFGKLDDLICESGNPDDAWNTYELTENGREMLK